MTDEERIGRAKVLMEAIDRVNTARKAAATAEKQFNYYSAQWRTWEEMSPDAAAELRAAYLELGRLLYR